MKHPLALLPLAIVTSLTVTATTSSVFAATSSVASGFAARDIRIEGLVRLSPASVSSLLPIASGDTITEQKLAEAIRALYASGNFDDVQASRDQDVLLFKVVERPVIASMTITGNKLIPTDSLTKGLKGGGISEGEVLKRSSLQVVKNELEQQYAQQGRYDAEVKIETVPKPNNRVDLAFKIYEGNAAKVVNIRVLGNTVFSDDEIKKAFQVKSSNWSSIVTRDDRYAREKMTASLESLRSLYLNKGYIHYALNSAQLNLSEDKKNIFIEVSVNEGAQYKFGESKFVGDPLYKNEDLKQLVIYKPGTTYSQAEVTATTQLLSKKFGNSGYYFAEINPIPEIDEPTKTVTMNYAINPGKQVYIRRINFKGNDKTADEVLRREMRQLEGSLASNEKIDLSKVRLERTGYFKTVTIDTPRVANSNDQVDVNVTVEEQPSGTSSISVGYSQYGGVTFQFGLNQTNFFGTGTQVGLDVSRSETLENYNINVLDPYYTVDGVSRGFNFYMRNTKLDSTYNVQRYYSDALGASMTFGYPVDENKSVAATLNVDNTTIKTSSFVSQVAQNYLLSHGAVNKSGDSANPLYDKDFLTYNLNLSWAYNTLNRPVLATRGMSHQIALDTTLPGSDVQYQRITYTGQAFFPLPTHFLDKFLIRAYTKLGYGHDLPFWKNFYAGGYGSVRGYRDYTLGPLSPGIGYCKGAGTTCPDPDPESVGGNGLITGGLELILPIPYAGDWASQIRPVLFVEGGQVFDTTGVADTGTNSYKFSAHNFRYSAGFGFTWITMIGPIALSYAQPIDSKPDDQLKRVQFAIGRVF
ncbi:outer membrane protein assembly factor BamA [Aquirhabdus sp.]|uniref:outer membrane protein assembly factor BamA n=1 Tax=Aquirhabdus sp. TaxID=2824160 RepID=UPI00396C3EB9